MRIPTKENRESKVREKGARKGKEGEEKEQKANEQYLYATAGAMLKVRFH